MCFIWRRRQWHPTPVLLPEKSHGQRSLVGCSPWGHKESDTTERLHFHFLLSCIGEGNGNPLQCSCLENPRDRGAWWAAVCGVPQSRTRLKRLSSSSSNACEVNVRQRQYCGCMVVGRNWNQISGLIWTTVCIQIRHGGDHRNMDDFWFCLWASDYFTDFFIF